MPAKWQQWMPFHIDRFKASPSVQAMHPTARAGYLYLLSCQWQSDDCTISSDPLDLAEQSGLGDELWAIHSARILRKFVAVTVSVTARSPSENGTVTVNRLRNLPCFEEWKEASRVFFARKNAADRTNSSRSPHGHRTLTERSPSRSADTITGTGTITDTNTKPKAERAPKSPGENGEFMLATYLWQELNYAAEHKDVEVLCAVIQAESKSSRASPEDTAAQLLAWAQEAQARGEVINRFWFKDRRYTGNGNHKPKPKVDETFDELRRHYGVAH